MPTEVGHSHAPNEVQLKPLFLLQFLKEHILCFPPSPPLLLPHHFTTVPSALQALVIESHCDRMSIRDKITSIFRVAEKASRTPRLQCITHINCTFNNTHVCVRDLEGRVLFKSSGGNVGFKGARRSLPEAATLAAEKVAGLAVDRDFVHTSVEVQGPSGNRRPALRGLVKKGMKVWSIKDVTPLPHNGCRPRKARRL